MTRVLEPNEEFQGTIGTPELKAVKKTECPYCKHEYDVGIYKDRELPDHYVIVIRKKLRKPRRWRLWRCIMDMGYNARMVEAREEIAWLELKGFKVKIWAPLPQHKTSGHTHIVVLCTLEEKCFLAGIEVKTH